MIHETRERYDPRLYEHFEFLYDQMIRRAERARPIIVSGST